MYEIKSTKTMYVKQRHAEMHVYLNQTIKGAYLDLQKKQQNHVSNVGFIMVILLKKKNTNRKMLNVKATSILFLKYFLKKKKKWENEKEAREIDGGS